MQVEIEDCGVVIVVVDTPFFVLPSLRAAVLNTTTPNFAGLQDEMHHFVVFAILLEHEVLLCTVLVEGLQELDLMVSNLIVDTMVLHFCWNQRLIWTVFFFRNRCR